MVEGKIQTNSLELLPSFGQSSSDLFSNCFKDDLAGPYSYTNIFKAKPVDWLNKLEVVSPPPASNEKDVPKKGDQHKPTDKAHTDQQALIKEAHQNGFTIKVVNGKYEYHHRVNGVDEIAFTTDGSQAEAEKQLHLLVEKKEAELTAKYGVQFSQAGDKTTVQNPVDESKSEATCREPSLKELEALEAALSANKYSPDGKQGPAFPKIYFLAEGKVKGFDASFTKDDTGQPAIFVYPTMLALPTMDDPYGTSLSMQQRFNHELNHWAALWQDFPTNGRVADHAVPSTSATAVDSTASLPPEDSLIEKPATTPDKISGSSGDGSDKSANGSDQKPRPDQDPDATPAEKARYERLGWKEITTVDGEKVWVVKGTDGHLYGCVEKADGKNVWVMVDEQGVPIDKNGKRIVDPHEKDESVVAKAIDKNGTVLTPYGVWCLMKPQPMTLYFTNPEEELSEAEGYYHSKNGRHLMVKNNPELYQESKALDQERINQVNGVGPDGQPLFIRSPDGKIVPNDAEHRAEVTAFEQAAQGKTSRSS